MKNFLTTNIRGRAMLMECSSFVADAYVSGRVYSYEEKVLVVY